MLKMRKTMMIIVAVCLLIGTASTETVHAATADIPETGQKNCYNSSGVLVSCSNTGQDGAFTKGVAWPATRFTNENGTTPVSGNVVVDQLTGLMWTRDGNGPGPQSCISATTKTKSWQGALEYVECLNSAGYQGFSDWRIPNVNELASLVDAGRSSTADWLNTEGFVNVQAVTSYGYWTSTSVASNTLGAWEVDLYDGRVVARDKTVALHVWPVRAGQ